MLRTPVLPDEQIDDFHRDGYVVIRGAFGAAEMRRIEAWTREPGDLAFFDSYAPLASKANMSDKIRRLYFATYNGLSEGNHLAEYHADKRKSFPPDIEREPGKEYVYRV